MRICIVADVFPRLSETFVVHQVEGLAARGHEVEVLCNDRGDDSGGALRRLARQRWGPLSFLRPAANRAPPRVRHRFQGSLDRLDVTYLRRFDVILANFGYEGARVARIKARVPGLPPLVTVFHGHDVATVAHDGAMFIYDDLFAQGARHLTVNRPFRETLVAAGAPPARTRVHHLGIPLDRPAFTPRNWAERPWRLLSVCRLTEKKGIEHALHALACVPPALDWRYRIVGDGELAPALRRLCTDLGLDARVEFLGARPNEEVRHLLAKSHLFLLPSVAAANGDAEGVPVSLMEAMASGAVVVSSVHSGIPELVEDGLGGFLAPERDHRALASRLIRAMEDEPTLAGMARAARHRVETDFSLETQIDRLEEELRTVAADAAPERLSDPPAAGVRPSA